MNTAQLGELEEELCTFCNRTMAEARRAELRALYQIAGRLHEHKTTAGDHVRDSLVRCGQRIRHDRTTLLRFAFVYKRIKPEEFERLIALSDARGYPPTFWDLIAIARLSLENRFQALVDRLASR